MEDRGFKLFFLIQYQITFYYIMLKVKNDTDLY